MISITSDNNILVQPGTYTATGTTMNGETGEEYTPSYTLDTAKTFYNHSTAPAEADAFYSFSNKNLNNPIEYTTSNGSILGTDGTDYGATLTNGTANDFSYTSKAFSTSVIVKMDITTGTLIEGAACNLGFYMKYTRYNINATMSATLTDSNGNQVGDTLTYTKTPANNPVNWYLHWENIYLESNSTYTFTLTFSNNTGNSGTLTLTHYMNSQTTYPAYSCKIGMENRHGRWSLREDYDNIWNLGYINFDEGSKEIPNSWSETPLYNTSL